MGNGNLTLHILGSMIEDKSRTRAEISRSRGLITLEKFWSAADTMAHKKNPADARRDFR